MHTTVRCFTATSSAQRHHGNPKRKRGIETGISADLTHTSGSEQLQCTLRIGFNLLQCQFSDPDSV
jgi:hypothetical protein